ncbi:MAG: YicC family protein [Ignavibacterium sp.]
MIYSMTGYGKAATTFKNYNIEVETRSVNNRYLEISLKLPTAFQEKEYELRELIRSKLKRGKIFISVSIKSIEGEDLFLTIDEKKINQVYLTLKQLKKSLKIKEAINLSHLLSFKDIFSYEVQEKEEELFNSIKNTIDDAINNLLLMRASEGAELKKDLEIRLNKIDETIRTIENTFSENLMEYFNRLKERTQQMIQDLANYEDRLNMELALLTEKSDITEECVRLKTHIKFFQEILNSDNEVGRRLNFLCQEMHREANTIASKSISSEVTHFSILIREEIEKIREQIQNVE